MTMNGHNSQENGSLHDRISLRAYELYEQRGRADGLEVTDWIKAEAEVLAAESSHNNELCTRLNLTPEATTLLECAERDDSKLIVANWGERLAALKTGSLKINVSQTGSGGKNWEDALNSLQQRDLIRHVGSKSSLHAYMLTISNKKIGIQA
jgi:hypothetical protein